MLIKFAIIINNSFYLNFQYCIQNLIHSHREQYLYKVIIIKIYQLKIMLTIYHLEIIIQQLFLVNCFQFYFHYFVYQTIFSISIISNFDISLLNLSLFIEFLEYKMFYLYMQKSYCQKYFFMENFFEKWEFFYKTQSISFILQAKEMQLNLSILTAIKYFSST